MLAHSGTVSLFLFLFIESTYSNSQGMCVPRMQIQLYIFCLKCQAHSAETNKCPANVKLSLVSFSFSFGLFFVYIGYLSSIYPFP